MKESYERPDIMFEDFSLSSNIAGNCEEIVGNPAKDSCGILMNNGDIIFNSSITGCVFKPEDMGEEDDQWDGFCYHVPIDEKSLFNS